MLVLPICSKYGDASSVAFEEPMSFREEFSSSGARLNFFIQCQCQGWSSSGIIVGHTNLLGR